MSESLFCHIDVETEHRLIEAITARCAADWVTDVHRYAPQLVHLMAQGRHEPAKNHATTIRQIVNAYSRVNAFNASPEEMERHIQIIIMAMDELRRDQLKAGEWSDAPVPPMMFG